MAKERATVLVKEVEGGYAIERWWPRRREAMARSLAEAMITVHKFIEGEDEDQGSTEGDEA